MSTDVAAPEAEQYKLCPQCRYATLASHDRCHHCLADVARAPLLHPDAAARRVAEQELREAESAAHRRRSDRIRQGVTGALIALVVVWVGWQAYRTFIWEPPPVPLPSSTERTMPATPEAWPTTGGNALATRATTARADLDAPERWQAALGAPLATRLVADAEQLYVTLEDGRLVAVRLADGSVAWETALRVTPIAAPTVAGDRLYLALPAGQLVALDTADGAERFASPTIGARFASSPVVQDGAVYVAGIGTLIAFDGENGDLLWERGINSTWSTLSPVVTGASVAVASGNRSLLYSRLTSAETYFYEYGRAHPYAIAASDDVIYTVSSRFIGAYQVDSRRPWWEGMRRVWVQFEIWQMAPSVPAAPILWTTLRPTEDGYPLALDAERLYLANAAGDLRGYARASGDERWRTSTAAIVAPPIVTGDGLLIAHRDRLAIYDPVSGNLIAERALPSVTIGATISDAIALRDAIFVARANGELIALGSDVDR